MLILFAFLACKQSSQTITTSDIAWKDGTLSMALAALEAKCGIQTPTDTPEDYQENIKKLQEEISLLDEQVVQFQKVLEEIQGSGVGSATLINFDPRATTLAAKNVQDALDEIMARIKVLEHHVLDEMGSPGPGLFKIPKDKKPKNAGPKHDNKQGPGGPPNQSGGGHQPGKK